MLEDSQRRAARHRRRYHCARLHRHLACSRFSGASIPEGMVDVIEQQPHVALAMGVISHIRRAAAGRHRHRSGRVQPHERRLHVSGRAVRFAGPDDIMVDELLRRSRRSCKWATPSTCSTTTGTSRGIIEGGKLARMVVPARASCRIWTPHTGKVSQIYVKLDDPANTDAVVDESEAAAARTTRSTPWRSSPPCST